MRKRKLVEENARLRRSADAWQEDARRYAINADDAKRAHRVQVDTLLNAAGITDEPRSVDDLEAWIRQRRPDTEGER